MFTVVNAPATVCAFVNIFLISSALHIVQPDLSESPTVLAVINLIPDSEIDERTFTGLELCYGHSVQ